VKAPNFYSSEATAFDYLQARAPARLWQEVLTQAIRDAVEGPPAGDYAHLPMLDGLRYRDAIRAAAIDWLADDANEPRRFVWVCEQLGLEPSAVRRSAAERKKA
jgi:hypothetical protein